MTIFYFFLVLAYATAANVTRCYNCDSASNKDCGDPFSANSTSVECSSLSYERKGLYSAVENVFNQGRADSPFNYGCLKLKLEAGSESAIVRSCAVVPTNVNEPCDLLNKTGLANCNYCTSDNCNSGTLHGVSVLFVGALLIFALRF